jgi:AraC-like DNA-binding protein
MPWCGFAKRVAYPNRADRYKEIWNLKAREAQEKTNFWRDPALGNLELLQATFVTHSYARHTHEGYAIGVIERGAEQFERGKEHHVAPQGSLVVINPGEVHTGSAAVEGGWSYRMLYPDPALLQQAASQMAGRQREVPLFAEPVIQDETLSRLLLQLHQALEQPLSSLERESRMLWLMGQLVLRHAIDRPSLHKVGQEHQAVRQVREFLEAHYAENITLEQLALIAHLSPFHLLRVFQREVGLPPHTYQTQVRIARAKNLLSRNWPISEVAFATGFTDQSHLTKQFKRITGVTPGQYRLT